MFSNSIIISSRTRTIWSGNGVRSIRGKPGGKQSSSGSCERAVAWGPYPGFTVLNFAKAQACRVGSLALNVSAFCFADQTPEKSGVRGRTALPFPAVWPLASVNPRNAKASVAHRATPQRILRLRILPTQSAPQDQSYPAASTLKNSGSFYSTKRDGNRAVCDRTWLVRARF